MAIAYTQEYFQQLLEMHEAQKTSAAFLEINDVAINYNTEYEALEAMANINNPWQKAWYYDPVRNSAGEVIGMDYVQVPTSVENPPAVINSNATNPVFTTGGSKVRINGSGGGTSPNVFSKGAKVLNTQLPTSTLASRVGLAIGTVALASKLGKKIDEAIYTLGGGWQYNPENWRGMLIGDDVDELDKAALRILFGIDDETGDVTPYLNADALGSMYLTLLQSEAFNPEVDTVQADSVPQAKLNSLSSSNEVTFTDSLSMPYIPSGTYAGGSAVWTSNVPVKYVVVMNPTTASEYNVTATIAASLSPFTVTKTTTKINGEQYVQTYNSSSSVIDGVTYYYANVNGSYTNRSIDWPASQLNRLVNKQGTYVTSYSSNIGRDIAYMLFNGTVIQGGGMEGVEDDTTGATYFPTPNTITGTDLDTVNQQLRQNYPQLYDGEVYEDVPQTDGTNKRITYIPVPFPNTSDKTKPITGDNHQNNPTSNPTTNTDDQLKDIIDLITQLTTPNLNPNPDIPTDTPTPDTGSGDSPPVTVPTGNASSLWAVYNPTQAQVDAFGSWLWSSSFVEQLKKLFNDPMQAIIGIHKVFATPATGATQTIVCGYIDSEVPSKIVTSQYTTIDCGTVNLREYFGNVFDYSPFTEVSLYLPFIGIVKLDVSDVMRAAIKVKYHVDVITGACLADVVVTRDNSGGVLYQYSGSAIVTYPISSGSYASAIGGILSIAGGIAATVMTGGAAAPAVLGAAAGISHLHSDVQKSGSFTGAAGAMGGKIPYLIISRPQTGMPSKFAHLQGFPVNYYTKLGSCTGHVRVSDVQVKGVNATDTELDMIRDALTQGIDI